MVYVFGIVGFIGGFSAGIFVINQLLRGKNRVELVNDKSLRWKYGTMVWIMAATGAWSGVWLHGQKIFG